MLLAQNNHILDQFRQDYNNHVPHNKKTVAQQHGNSS